MVPKSTLFAKCLMRLLFVKTLLRLPSVHDNVDSSPLRHLEWVLLVLIPKGPSKVELDNKNISSRRMLWGIVWGWFTLCNSNLLSKQECRPLKKVNRAAATCSDARWRPPAALVETSHTQVLQPPAFQSRLTLASQDGREPEAGQQHGRPKEKGRGGRLQLCLCT